VYSLSALDSFISKYIYIIFYFPPDSSWIKLKSENEFSMVKFSNYCFKPERKVNMESKNECKQNQAKTQKTNLTKTKDWAPHPPTTPHRTSPRWESSVKPKYPPVALSKLERIEFNGTPFYLLYSRAAVSPLSESEF